jgi:ABC-type nitrate/sulfonate/bicarbonate transport system permease component
MVNRLIGGRAYQFGKALAVPALILSVWQLASGGRPSNSAHATPVGVGAALIGMGRSGLLQQALSATGQRVLFGFALALGLALLVAVLQITSRPFDRVVDPLLETLRPLAPVAWVPLAMFWFGATNQAAVFIVTYAAFFPIVTNVAAGIRQLDPRLVEAARTLGARRAMAVREVLVPGALPMVLAGARLGLGTAWVAIIAAELTIGSVSGQNGNEGIGQAMFSAFLYSARLEPILALIVVVGVVAFLLDAGLRQLEQRLTPWASR